MHEYNFQINAKVYKLVYQTIAYNLVSYFPLCKLWLMWKNNWAAAVAVAYKRCSLYINTANVKKYLLKNVANMKNDLLIKCDIYEK